MSTRIINIVVIMLISFFVVFFGLKIGYDTSVIDKADSDYNNDYKDKYESSFSATTDYKYYNLDNVKFL